MGTEALINRTWRVWCNALPRLSWWSPPDKMAAVYTCWAKLTYSIKAWVVAAGWKRYVVVVVRTDLQRPNKVSDMKYSRTGIYRISADCDIYHIYLKSDISRELPLFRTKGTENFMRYIWLSDITESHIYEFYCIAKTLWNIPVIFKNLANEHIKLQMESVNS